MKITTTASSAFEKVYLDIVGPLIKSDGFEYILTTQCELSKFITATPIPDKTTLTVANAFVTSVILKYGVPKTIVSDRGTEFMSELFTSVANILGIEKLNSTAYHHQTIGALENSHKVLGTYLRIQCDGKLFSWSEWLPFYEFSYNNTVHSSTGHTPFYLVYGKLSNVPSNLTEKSEEQNYNLDEYTTILKKLRHAHEAARKQLLNTKIQRKTNYDENKKLVNFKAGELVLIKDETSKKLQAKYKGPFKVIDDLGENIQVKINKKLDTVHKDRIKRYLGHVVDKKNKNDKNGEEEILEEENKSEEEEHEKN